MSLDSSDDELWAVAGLLTVGHGRAVNCGPWLGCKLWAMAGL